LLYEEHPGNATERGDMLPQATKKAIELLSQNKKGFFLMVEGSQIDWGGHNNDTEYLAGEMVDFDKVIGIAIDFAKRDGNTLVVITADHETGGATIISGNPATGDLTMKFTTDHHTGIPVPVYAYGAGAENFSGIFENTTFLQKFLKLFGF
jgi:alkaline phosphatase